MKLLCSSSSLAFVHSLRIALEGEDIETYCSDADRVMAGIAGPLTSGAGRLYVLHDEDWERAVAVMHALSPPQAPRSASVSSGGLPKWLFVAFGALAVIVLAGLIGH
jgi:hypothetical protein